MVEVVELREVGASERVVAYEGMGRGERYVRLGGGLDVVQKERV